jgi:hypothetical protein
LKAIRDGDRTVSGVEGSAAFARELFECAALGFGEEERDYCAAEHKESEDLHEVLIEALVSV